MPQSVSANAGPKTWAGTSGSELTMTHSCPIEVRSEHLTISVNSDDKQHTLKGDVLAKYSLFNPTDESIFVDAYFPIICHSKFDSQGPHFITFNGEEVKLHEFIIDIDDHMTIRKYHLEEVFDKLVKSSDIYHSSSDSILMVEFQIEISPRQNAELEICSSMYAFMEDRRIGTHFSWMKYYTFNYLFSPAQRWSSFGNITVNLLLPERTYVLKESNLLFRPQGKNCYVYDSGQLPGEDLEFVITTNIGQYLLKALAVFFLVTQGVVLFTALMVVLIQNKLNRIKQLMIKD